MPTCPRSSASMSALDGHWVGMVLSADSKRKLDVYSGKVSRVLNAGGNASAGRSEGNAGSGRRADWNWICVYLSTN